MFAICLSLLRHVACCTQVRSQRDSYRSNAPCCATALFCLTFLWHNPHLQCFGMSVSVSTKHTAPAPACLASKIRIDSLPTYTRSRGGVREFPLRTLSILLVGLLIIFRDLFRVLLLIIFSYLVYVYSRLSLLCRHWLNQKFVWKI